MYLSKIDGFDAFGTCAIINQITPINKRESIQTKSSFFFIMILIKMKNFFLLKFSATAAAISHNTCRSFLERSNWTNNHRWLIREEKHWVLTKVKPKITKITYCLFAFKKKTRTTTYLKPTNVSFFSALDQTLRKGPVN